MDTAHHAHPDRSLRGLRTSIQSLSTDPQIRRRLHAAFLLTLAVAAGIGSAGALDSRAREQVRAEGPGVERLSALLVRLQIPMSLMGPQGEPAAGKTTLAWLDPESHELWISLPGSGRWAPMGKGWNAVEALLAQLKPQQQTANQKRMVSTPPRDPRHWQC